MGKSRPDKRAQQFQAMESHGEIGWANLEEERWQESLASYRSAVELARQLGQKAHLAVYLGYQALAAREQGDLDLCEKSLEEAIEVACKNSFVEVETQNRLMMAEHLDENGRSDEAIEHCLSALEIANQGGDAIAVEISLSHLGRLYLDRGWAEQALTCFRQALAARQETQDKAALMGSLGLSLVELGQYAEAISHFRTSYLEAEFAEDRQSMSVARGSEGNALFELGSYDKALTAYREAHQLSSDAGDRRRQGAWLGNMGTTFLALGDVDSAIEHCRKAREIARQEGDVQSEAAHLDSIGDCLVEKGDLEEARKCYELALNMSEEISDRLGQRIYLSNLGRLHKRLGQLQPAFEYLGAAANLFEDQRATINADDLKTSFANRGEELYKDVVRVSLSMGRRVEALEYVGKAKSRALLDLLSNSPIDISTLVEVDDDSLRALVEKEKSLRSQIDHLERVIWQGQSVQPEGGQQPESGGTRGARMSMEEAQGVYASWRETVHLLKQCHPNYASLVSASTLDYSEVQALWDDNGHLPRSTAVIELFATDEYFLAASVWSGAGDPAVELVSDPETLEPLIMDIETLLEMSSTEGWEVPTSICQRLYDQLLRSVIEPLPGSIDRLIIVPHGILFHLPFATLHDSNAYLCKRFAISYVPSLTLIPVLAATGDSAESDSSRQTRYLVSAISDYSATRKDGLVFSSNLRSSSGLDDLRHTLEEAKSVFEVGSKTAVDSKLVTNEEVKGSLPSLFSDYQVIHFAGHAIFNPDYPMASGLVLADGTVLTAASILERRSLTTSCGRLLVLSACQTGVSAVTPGGEILGLARALIYAGMPNLVLTLWEVADRSTSTIMQDFHNIWQAGKTTVAKAVQEAQIKAIESGQPVHSWAPFIHFGID